MPSGLSIWTRDSELVVAAGLLDAAGDLNDQLTVEAATARLRELLTPAALWWSGPLPLSHLGEPPHRYIGAVPRWHAPNPALLEKLASTLRAAWRAALPVPPYGWGAPVLRLEVADAQAAQQLAALGAVGSYQVAPYIRRHHATGFAWRWPMRIGIADGPRSDQWRRELERSPYASLYDLRVVGPASAEPFDVVFVDADTAPTEHSATCVVVMGETASPAERLVRGRENDPQAAIVIGAASADVDWFEGAVREMAHDQPIDVALRIASPTSLIAADPHWLALTAVRQWSLELAEQLGEQSAEEVELRGRWAEDRLRTIGTDAVFNAEQHGAEQVTREVRALEQRGYDTELRPRPVPMAPPPGEVDQVPDLETADEVPDLEDAVTRTRLRPESAPTHRSKPPQPSESVAAQSPPRRLIADAKANGRFRRKTLLPNTDHDLLVKIAIPRRGEVAAQSDFPEGELPTGASIELMVDVTSPALDLRARLPIVLSTADRSAPSTTAVFTFHTLGEGTAVDIKVLVTWQERPLQEAHYVASVRNEAIDDDRARLIAVPLSSASEPLRDATPAQLSLEVNGANLERTGSRRAVDLSQVRDTLEQLDLVASRVLADATAPEQLAGEPAEELLVSLARAGASLWKFLVPLGIGDATTISLLVDATTPVLPLELVYERPAPRIGARLCEHRRGGTMVGKAEICPDAGKAVVCPYAFWGQQRVIARTIRLDSTTAPDRQPAPLSLRPILYAAVKHADEGAPETEKPSDVLEAELAGIVGAAQVARVDSWSEWKRTVQKTHPQLLVVLGHTVSSAGETLLEIGDKSWLRDPDIDVEYLHADASPMPLVVLLACSSAVPRNSFGGLPAAFTGAGAAAVVATLTKLHGPQGARAAAAVVRALCGGNALAPARLGDAMTAARRRLIEDGLLVGLLLVSHGEIDLPLVH